MATSFVFVRPYVYEGVCIAVYMGKREETVASCSATMCLSPLRRGLTLDLELASFRSQAGRLASPSSAVSSLLRLQAREAASGTRLKARNHGPVGSNSPGD